MADFSKTKLTPKVTDRILVVDGTGVPGYELMGDVMSILKPTSTTWKQVQTDVQNGLGPTLYPVGTKLYVYKCASSASKGTYLKYYLDVVGHNQHFLTRHGEKASTYSMTLGVHELFNELMVFDAAESQYGKSLDTSVVSWKTYYSDTSGTVVTSPTGNPSSNGYYEKNDTSTYPRSTYGSNNWRHSGLRKWLNALPNLSAGSWWTATTPFDMAPSYSSYLPFQALLSDEDDGAGCSLLDVIGPVTIRTILNTIKNPDNSSYYLDADADGVYAVSSRKSYDETEDTFFLPSTKEIHCSTYNEEGGVCLEYYEKFSDYTEPISAWGKTDNNLYKHYQSSASSYWWWLRSAYTSYANRVMVASGRVSGDFAISSYGVSPLCVIY